MIVASSAAVVSQQARIHSEASVSVTSFPDERSRKNMHVKDEIPADACVCDYHTKKY